MPLQSKYLELYHYNFRVIWYISLLTPSTHILIFWTKLPLSSSSNPSSLEQAGISGGGAEQVLSACPQAPCPWRIAQPRSFLQYQKSSTLNPTNVAPLHRWQIGNLISPNWLCSSAHSLQPWRSVATAAWREREREHARLLHIIGLVKTGPTPSPATPPPWPRPWRCQRPPRTCSPPPTGCSATLCSTSVTNRRSSSTQCHRPSLGSVAAPATAASRESRRQVDRQGPRTAVVNAPSCSSLATRSRGWTEEREGEEMKEENKGNFIYKKYNMCWRGK